MPLMNYPAAAQQFPAGRRVWLAGVPVDCIGEDEVLTLFERTVRRGDRIVLANLNLHGWYAALTTPVMLDLLKARDSVVHIDGTPILWIARLLGARVSAKARNGHIDLIPKMLRQCAGMGLPIAIVGADEAGAEVNRKVLEAMAPGLQVLSFSGYFDMDDHGSSSYQTQIIDKLREHRPALLLVGMDMPRQEKWIAQIKDKVDVNVIMPVGGFADYFAGRTRIPPRFLGVLGLEWLFRLVHDPRRLAFRYLVEPLFLAVLLVQLTLKRSRWGRDRSMDNSLS